MSDELKRFKVTPIEEMVVIHRTYTLLARDADEAEALAWKRLAGPIASQHITASHFEITEADDT